MDLNAFKAATKLRAGKSLLALKKHSPTILMSAGLAGMVTTAVLSSKATLKLEGVMDEHDETLKTAKEFRASVIDAGDNDAIVMANGKSVTYTEEDYKKDVLILHVRTATQIGKLYWLAGAVGVVSIAAIIGGHVQLTKRNAALAASFASLQIAYQKYRDRVVEEFGEDKDAEFRRPREVITEVKDADSGEVREELVMDPNGLSLHARFFDESNIHWTKEPGYNQVFLQNQERFANDLLRTRGHLFLNEIYDSLGMERTQAGSVMGWKLGMGDEFISFGIYDKNNVKAREFVNGTERSILLDFNVAGYIYNKI